MTGVDETIHATEEEFGLYRCSPYEHTETAELPAFLVISPAIQATQAARTINQMVARVPSLPHWLQMAPSAQTLQLIQPPTVELTK